MQTWTPRGSVVTYFNSRNRDQPGFESCLYDFLLGDPEQGTMTLGVCFLTGVTCHRLWVKNSSEGVLLTTKRKGHQPTGK